jgi:hypothetical protein
MNIIIWVVIVGLTLVGLIASGLLVAGWVLLGQAQKRNSTDVKVSASVISQSQIKAYLKILSLEIPRRFSHQRHLRHNWADWQLSNSETSKVSLKYQVDDIHISSNQLQTFKELITSNYVSNSENSKDYQPRKGSISDESLHLLAMYSLVIGKLQLYALSDPAFPLPVLGAVHLSNEFTLYQKWNEASPLLVKLEVRNFQAHARGIILEMESKIFQQNILIWTCKTMILSFTSFGKKALSKQPSLPRSDDSLKSFLTQTLDAIGGNQSPLQFKLESDIGRKFATICGDYNPVHLHPITARMFGFPGAIAHGMCVLGKSWSVIEAPPQKLPLHCTVYFLKPLILPAAVCVNNSQTNENTSLIVQSKSGTVNHVIARFYS